MKYLITASLFALIIGNEVLSLMILIAWVVKFIFWFLNKVQEEGNYL